MQLSALACCLPRALSPRPAAPLLLLAGRAGGARHWRRRGPRRGRADALELVKVFAHLQGQGEGEGTPPLPLFQWELPLISSSIMKPGLAALLHDHDGVLYLNVELPLNKGPWQRPHFLSLASGRALQHAHHSACMERLSSAVPIHKPAMHPQTVAACRRAELGMD